MERINTCSENEKPDPTAPYQHVVKVDFICIPKNLKPKDYAEYLAKMAEKGENLVEVIQGYRKRLIKEGAKVIPVYLDDPGRCMPVSL